MGVCIYACQVWSANIVLLGQRSYCVLNPNPLSKQGPHHPPDLLLCVSLLSAVAVPHPRAAALSVRGSYKTTMSVWGENIVAWRVGSGYRLTARTCASFCKLGRIHALNHVRDKFLHTRIHSLGSGDDEITRETPNLQTTALSKNKMERTGS